jgi:putative nucleotidyltransferase with HDIG domain
MGRVASDPSGGRPATLIVFISAVIAIGLVVIGHSLAVLDVSLQSLEWVGLGGLAILAGCFALKVPGVPVYLSISDAVFITSALLFGPAPATITIAVDSFIVSLRRRNDGRQLLFNSTSSALALWCGAHVYYVLTRQNPLSPGSPSLDATIIAPIACLAAVYFLLNSGLTAVAVALSKGISAFSVWRQHFAVISLNYLAAASAAFVFVMLVSHVGMLAIAAVVPMVLVCHVAMRSSLGRVDDAQRHLTRVNQLYLSTISALSTAIEAKDGVTSDHIQRVQAYAMGLARGLEVNEPAMLQAIEAAALLHDTGKLAIPEHILNKPGKLTEGELQTMRSHVTVGADILSTIDFPYPVVPIVRAHHENWDGSGYPDGLRGEEIPIGARILSVVDCFDALISDRPYRPAMAEAAALDVIVGRRGTMYDPKVVDTFLSVYKDVDIPTPRPQLQAVVHNIRNRATTVAPDGPAAATTSTPPAVQTPSDDLFGFVSLARFTSGSATVRDVGAFAWSQLRHFAPRVTAALFVVDESKVSLVAQHIAGPAADRVPLMTIGVGERISGWVAANRRSMTDADAALELGKGCDAGLRFALSTPLVADGGLVGVLTLYGPEPLGHQLALSLEMIGPHLAKAVASAVAAQAMHPSVADQSAPHARASARLLRSSDHVASSRVRTH